MDHPERSVSEVASLLGIPKSTAHALLRTMCDIGLLRRTADRRYRLGWRILALSTTLLATTQYRVEARPVMGDLVARFGETVHLATMESGRVLYVDKLQGTRAVQVSVTGIGVELPAHCSAVGKILLAFQPWPEVEALLSRTGLPPLTPNTITDPERLRAELEEVRERGYALDIEEAVLELCCVAAPIRDHRGEVVAAMSLSVPAYRFHRQKDELRRAIVAACREVSYRLGYTAYEDTQRRRQAASG